MESEKSSRFWWVFVLSQQIDSRLSILIKMVRTSKAPKRASEEEEEDRKKFCVFVEEKEMCGGIRQPASGAFLPLHEEMFS